MFLCPRLCKKQNLIRAGVISIVLFCFVSFLLRLVSCVVADFILMI